MSLSCPACEGALIPVETEGHYGTPVILETCVECQGFWADVHEPNALAAKAALRLEGKATLDSIDTQPHGAGRTCPRCDLGLIELSGPPLPEGLHVDSCGSCDGMWFDPGELLVLKAKHEDDRQKRLMKHRDAIAESEGFDLRAKMLSERERKRLASNSYNVIRQQFF